MRRNIDEAAQEKRRREAWHSAWMASGWMLLTGILILLLRSHFQIRGLGGFLMLCTAIINFGGIAPVWILLKTRLKEIEGGEEDAATEY